MKTTLNIFNQTTHLWRADSVAIDVALPCSEKIGAQRIGYGPINMFKSVIKK